MKANGVEREGSYLNHDESQELRSDCKMAGLEATVQFPLPKGLRLDA